VELWTRFADRKGKDGNPPPTAGAPAFYPDRREGPAGSRGWSQPAETPRTRLRPKERGAARDWRM